MSEGAAEEPGVTPATVCTVDGTVVIEGDALVKVPART